MTMNAELLLAGYTWCHTAAWQLNAHQNYLIHVMCKLLDWWQISEKSNITMCSHQV